MTLAVALGIPLGTFVGQLFSWRIPFLFVSVLGALSLMCLSKFFPKLGIPEKHTLAERLSALRSRPVIMTLLITF